MKRKIKEMTALLACAAMLLPAAGCGSSDGAAEDMVNKLMKAAQEADFDEMEECIADESWDTNLRQTLTVDAWMNFVEEQAPKITYEVKNVEDGGKEATVTVEATYIDGADAYNAAFNACFSEITAQMSDEESTEEMTEDVIYESLDNHLKEEAAGLDEEACKKTVTLTFTCSKDDDWKVTAVGDDFLALVSANLTGYAEALGDTSATAAPEE